MEKIFICAEVIINTMGKDSIEQYGNFTMAKYQRDITYITSMEIEIITASRICR